MRTFQKLQDIFLEISPGVDLSLIEKRRRPALGNLPCDLLRHPSVTRAMAYEYETLSRWDRLSHRLDSTPSTVDRDDIRSSADPHGPLFALDPA